VPSPIRFLPALLLLALPATAAPTQPPIDVQSYSLDLEVRPAETSIAGEVEIRFESLVETLSEMALDAPGLTIESVRAGDRDLPFRVEGDHLLVRLEPAARRGESRTLRVRYSGRPEKGLRFGTDQVFTAFATSRWMVSNDVPGDKATFEMRLVLPAGLEVVASGRPVSRETLPDGRVRHVWREDRPVSPFLYGFAAGRFREASVQEGSVELRFLAPGFTPEELRTIFARTGEVLRFFERRAGVPYPGPRYTQVLLPGGPAQEMNVLTLMDEDYGRAVLADPREDYLVIHELAHQWWANLVTCRTWSDFWLHEGMVSFLVAAFKEFYWGREESDRERVLARLRYEQAFSEGARRPLATEAWSRAEDMSGPITYRKGALVLHLLRHEIGDAAFWNGLRAFTRSAVESGGLADSRDLQKAMEQASGQPLAWFFDQWVYGNEPEIVARHREEPGAVAVEIEQRGPKPWRIGIDVAVETESERIRRRVVLTQERENVRIPVSGRLLSVRIDDGGFLPRREQHERPWDMLVWQAIHEPDAPGRSDALLALTDLCMTSSPPARCTDLPALLRERAIEDGARVVRQVAERMSEKLTPPDAAPH
jgi:aminopeptidase N